jgi:plasmid stability protein
MASLLVRQLDEVLVQRLKARAAAKGRSAEAEHRAILEEALRPPRTGKDMVDSWAKYRDEEGDPPLDWETGLDQTTNYPKFE